jgi:molybdenum cofactor sulfurtransferase
MCHPPSDVVSLKHGFALLEGLGGVGRVQQHVGALTAWTYDR